MVVPTASYFDNASHAKLSPKLDSISSSSGTLALPSPTNFALHSLHRQQPHELFRCRTFGCQSTGPARAPRWHPIPPLSTSLYASLLDFTAACRASSELNDRWLRSPAPPLSPPPLRLRRTLFRAIIVPYFLAHYTPSAPLFFPAVMLSSRFIVPHRCL